MSETLPPEIGENIREPFDGLKILGNYNFLDMCMTMENDVAITKRDNPNNLYKLLDRINLSLSERYGKDLEYQQIVASGKAYPVLSTDTDAFCANKKQPLNDTTLRFARITFAPVNIDGNPSYKVALRLLPDEQSDVDHYFMLLEDAEKLIFTERLAEVPDSDRLLKIFAHIARKADDFGKSSAYTSLARIDKTDALDQLVATDTAMIQPLVEQQIPLLINAHMYSKRRGITDAAYRGTFTQHRQPEKATEMRTIIAGRTKGILHSPEQSPKAPLSSELLVIENGNDRQKNMYRIPLNQIVSIQSL